MNVLILGSGGREHALAWRLAQDESCQRIYLWPGNAGMLEGHNPKFHDITEVFSEESFKRNLKDLFIKLVVPGAEDFMFQGVGDWSEELGVPCFGPKKAAAELERSKLFSKQIMTKAHIATARYEDLTLAFTTDIESTKKLLDGFQKPVIKISGPSLGKGVFVCEDAAEAYSVLEQIKAHPLPGLSDGIFVEEGLKGKEVSLFFACHGETFEFLGGAQDHKRLLDQDRGPNTGGMGTLSPVEWVTEKYIQFAAESFVIPTLRTMKAEGKPFTGMLFLGLMVSPEGSFLLEYNVRFGDPETQVLMPLLEGDLTQAFHDIALGKKLLTPWKIKSAVAVHVVKAAKGYPGTFGETIERGQKIRRHARPDHCSQFFYAGVKKTNGDLVTNGGRVLGLTAWDQSKDLARIRAYERLNQVSFDGEQYRRDIGVKS